MVNWRCWFRHAWQTHQHCVQTDDQPPPGHGTRLFLIAWKQCTRCAKSRLIHVLI